MLRIALILMVAACGEESRPSAPAGPTIGCNDLGVHVGSFKSVSGQAVADRCSADHWNDDIRTCIMEAGSLRELGRCQARMSNELGRWLATTIAVDSPVKLPPPRQPDEPKAPLKVVIARDGSVTVAGDPVDDTHLDSVLAAVARTAPTTNVILYVDEAVKYQHIIEVMDRVKKAGLSKLALATAPR